MSYFSAIFGVMLLAGYGYSREPEPTGSPDQKATIELIDWYVSFPVDEDGNGKPDEAKEHKLSNGWMDKRFFYRAEDGGYVFRCPLRGVKTSASTRYTRVELREMLRRGDTNIKTKGVNKNNWVFKTASEKSQLAAGGVGGKLAGTLAINRVSTKGEADKVGRVIFAQIHGARNEPLRLFYRKLPGNKKGAVYFVHEDNKTRKQTRVGMIGSRKDNVTDKENADGIELNERFSYVIEADGHTLSVRIIRAGKADVTQTFNMEKSGYDGPDEYLYFKAGAYVQDDSKIEGDFCQLTYYALENSHGPPPK